MLKSKKNHKQTQPSSNQKEKQAKDEQISKQTNKQSQTTNKNKQNLSSPDKADEAIEYPIPPVAITTK